MAPPRIRSLGEAIRGRRPQRIGVRPLLRQLELQSVIRVRPLFDQYRDVVGSALFDVLDYIGKPEAPKFDDPHDIIERTFAGLRVVVARIFDPKQVGRIAQQNAFAIDASNRGLFRKQVHTVLNVNPIMAEPWIVPSVERFVRENISLITSVPTESLTDIEQMLYRDAERKLSPKAMKKKIIEQFDLSDARSEMIARDQTLKFNGSLSELRQTNLGIKEYIWRTSQDERVRADHRRLDGRTFKWSEPPVTVTSGKRAGERNHPGKDIQCRCHPEPILDLDRYASRKDEAEFEEGKHPRARDGKFGHGEGNATGGKSKSKPSEPATNTATLGASIRSAIASGATAAATQSKPAAPAGSSSPKTGAGFKPEAQAIKEQAAIYASHKASLTPEQALALRQYQRDGSGSSSVLNTYLRSGVLKPGNAEKTVKAKIAAVDAAMKPIDGDVTLYRGTHAIGDLKLPTDINEARALIGKTATEKGYSSTSIAETPFVGGGGNDDRRSIISINTKGMKGAHVFSARDSKAVSKAVEKGELLPEGSEVLLQRNLSLRITGVSEKTARLGGKILVYEAEAA